MPAGFDAVIAKGMAKDPDQRYASTVEFAAAARNASTVPIPRPTASPAEVAPNAGAVGEVRRPSQRTKIALIAAAVVVLVAPAVGVSAIFGRQSPTSSPSSKSSQPTYSAQVVVASTSFKPGSVAVDRAGTVYVTDSGQMVDTDYVPDSGRALKLAADSSTQEVLPFTGLDGPGGVTVDSVGNLYIADNGNSRILKLPVR